MTPEEQASRAVVLMKRKIRASVKASNESLQTFEGRLFYAGWFKNVGCGVRLHMEALFKVLLETRQDPVEFFQETCRERVESSSQDVTDSGVRKKALEMAREAVNYLLRVDRGAPRHSLLRWRKDIWKARLASILEAAHKAGIDELQFLVEALAGFAACGEDVARLLAKVLGARRERSTRQVNRALENLHTALGIQMAISVGSEATPERFLSRFDDLWSKRGKGVGSLGRVWLEEMDEQRYTDAPGVVMEFDQHLEEIEPELVPLALGVLGSALRLDFWYARAERCIQLGQECADEVLDHSTAGDLHLRMTMVKWDKGEQDEAFAQNGLAFARFLEAGDEVGEARATVDKAGLLLYRGEFARSIKVVAPALDRLPKNRNKAAALYGLAHCHMQLGNLERANRFLVRVLEMPLSTLYLGKTKWSLGSLRYLEKNYNAAASCLFEARELIRELAPVDSALITIDLCEVFLTAGEIGQAKAEARGMMQFIEPLRARTPLAEAAARGLALAGTRAEGFTLALLEKSRKKLKAKPVRK